RDPRALRDASLSSSHRGRDHHGRGDRIRDRPHLGRQRDADRARAHRSVPAHPTARGRNRRLPCRDPSLGGRPGSLGRRERRPGAGGQHPRRLHPGRADRQAGGGQGAHRVPAKRPRPGADRVFHRPDHQGARATGRPDPLGHGRSGGDRRPVRRPDRTSSPAPAPARRESRARASNSWLVSTRLPVMDFELTPQVEELRDRIRAFMGEHVYPVELEAMQALDAEVGPGTPYPEVLVEIRNRAREDGLWNLFMPDQRYGAGLGNWEYGVLCEEMGRSPAVAPMAFNCSAPDTGNMEILAEHGTDQQREQWLQPLLEGKIRSCFSMTEPEVAGSDPTTLQTRAELDGDEWVINGHKWFTSGAVGASVAIVMAVTDPDAQPHLKASMILVP